MKNKILLSILVTYIITISSSVVAQSQRRFYDQKTLYENAELIQLSPTERQQRSSRIRQKQTESKQAISDTSAFYSLEEPIRKKAPRNLRKDQKSSFESVAKQVRQQRRVERSEDQDSNLNQYFIDF
ncbi:MAG: hypothetical protein CL521_03635 [Actinobacteria bacterium]|nr:hypothetical protein [Actinomycetota bacterium]